MNNGLRFSWIRILLAGSFFALLLTTLFPTSQKVLGPNFDQCMQKANPSFIDVYSSTPKVSKQWKTVKSLYESYTKTSSSKKVKIPKIIHQIWLGGEIPQKYAKLQESWQRINPDFEYKLWTDEDIPSFPFQNKKRFEKAVNVGEKADILRYEILNRFGGLYVDTDFECLKPFDFLHHQCDLYVGIEAAFTHDSEVHIGNALIGSIPNHPVIQYCLKRIASKPAAKTPDEVQDISGPGCLKRAFFKYHNKGNYKNVAFPYTFFFPLPSQYRDGFLGKMVKSDWIEPESLGVHYWETSWGDQEFDL